MAFLKVKNLFLDPNDSDIKIKVQTVEDQKEFEIPGHSIIIRRVSKVLQATLDTENFVEGKRKALEIKVQGNVQDAMSFLRFLYTRKLENLDITSYLSILPTAHLYKVEDLIEHCLSRICKKVTPYSVCKMYLALENLATEEYKCLLVDMMLKSAFLIFEKELHVSLSETTIELLLESDQLNVRDERQAIHALWTWARTRAITENTMTEDYIKNKTTHLLCLIRRCFITCPTQSDPWFYLIVGNTCISESSDQAREPDPRVPLISVCNVLKLNERCTCSTNTELSEKVTALQLSVNRLCFLTGLAFHVETNDEDFFFQGRFYVNNIDTIIDKWEESPRGNNDKCCNRFPLSVLLEFQNPILLTTKSVNTIAIGEYTYFSNTAQRHFHMSVPVYKSKYGGKNIKTSITDPSTVFIVHGDVIAIGELYYLPR